MYIEKYEFNGRELVFDPRMNIIIGANGSGKSRLLNELKETNPYIANPYFSAIAFMMELDYFNKDEYEGVIFAENIEERLHPNWQRTLVSRLITEFPKVQFFITTYSPFIVQSAGRGQVIDMDGCDLSDVEFSKLSINEIAYEIMGVESVYSATEQEAEILSGRYLEILKALRGHPFLEDEPLKAQLTLIETQIEDPAIRAFLKMNRSEAEAVRLKKIEYETQERKL